MEFVTVCGDAAGRMQLALAADGTLWKADLKHDGNDGHESMNWEPVDFNGMYAGYYTPCHFTSLLATKVDFVAAGVGGDGLPYVYRSLYGGVWDQVVLVGKTAMNGMVQAKGRINIMLFEPVTTQVFLLCDNGELVTLPDCPKCVKIRKIADQAIVSGEICGKSLVLGLENGERLTVGVSDVVQYRIAYSYAGNYLASHGGTIVWLGKGEPDFGQIVGEELSQIRMICMNSDDVTDWLRETCAADGATEQFVAFWCDYGVQADAAADAARRMGFMAAFSLGGEREYLHVV